MDFSVSVYDQRDKLIWLLNVGLALASEGDIAGWFNPPDHCTCLGIEDDTVFLALEAAAHSA